ncbi:MAG: substrate-binding domain-containing protein [Nitriliruptoraceae bacterium]|nr:substrate-binding domain-containing protein [Nitriliruptoraceae bacterium]
MREFRARLAVGAAAVGVMVFAAACGSVEDAPSATEDPGADGSSDESVDEDAGVVDAGSDDEIRIVTVSKIEGITWFQRMSEGVDMFSEANEGVNAFQTGPDSDDPAAQVAIVEDLIAQGVDGIIVVPNDPIGIGPVLSRARDAGIVVGVTEATQLVGTGSIDFDIESFDNADFGRGFGEGLVEAMGCEGQYATSVGNLTSESHILWLEAAIEYIEETCPDMENVSPTPYENFNDDQRGRELADEILSTFPDLRGYLATTPSGTSGMASALRERGITEGVANVGLTLPSVAGPDLEDGYMDYGQGWDPAGWGWALNEVALRLIRGEEIQEGDDLGWPLGGYESITLLEGGELILGNDIQPYTPGMFADGDYPF